MFPINQYAESVYYKRYITLHSTMFPINRVTSSNSEDKFDELYIPLCFLLINPRSLYNYELRDTLHSTMFPINRSGTDTRRLGGCLYIPLCFLLIFGLFPMTLATALTLHSTMFPINRY